MSKNGKLGFFCQLNIHTEHHFEYVQHPDPDKNFRIWQEYDVIKRHYCRCNAYHYTWWKSTNAQFSWQPNKEKVTTKWYRPYKGDIDPLIDLLS